jgi:hypothetical protein
MTKKERDFSPVAKCWLHGYAALMDYLEIKDKRTLKKEFLDKGLKGHAMGGLIYYHVKEVDHFIFKNSITV